MNTELLLDAGSLCTALEDPSRVREIAPQNITVILPAYNEEVSIGSVVLRARKFSDRVIVVDDASSDHTVEVAEMAGARVVRNPVTRGKEISLKKGIEAADDSDFIVTMETGVCHDPGLIPRMIAPLRDGDFDLAVGTCFSKQRKGSENVFLINNKESESKPVGFMAFSRECLSKINFSHVYLSSIHSIMTSAEEANLRILHIDIQEEHESSLFRAYKIGVVVPAYNEENLIQETIDGIPAYVDKIYVINDCSTDRTAEIINSTTDPRVVPIHHEVNKGVGAAIINGYKRALADRMDLVAVMAGDNQMDPTQLPKLIMPIIEGKADYTKGNRLLSREMRTGMPAWRAFGNGLLSLITKIGSGYWHIADPQNGYTVISGHALETLDLDSIYTYYGYCNDMLIKMNAFGMRVVDVTMPARYGTEKSKIRYGKYIRKVAPMIFRGFLWRLKMKYMVLDFHPLVLFYIASMVLVPLGFLFGVWIVLQKVVFHGPVSANYPLLDVFISLMGIQLLFFAMFFDMQVNNSTDVRAV
ncbi:glycosyltransferase family 2 protein [Methanosarcina sp. KYL-1]|uniref:glycosyltransferase family 2 protein n=1 Tax=Methanosarcina sp. KYL-1 TaxID=2602068 RepID=UPI00210073DE|nr:glycosyltransferase family 2 protein [Methanosarcina sp. KYL-1]MCQ1535087.1 glycosyltransferase family 2 protein [Methanosarcina sp. KYL-1]